jgi:hypothetical protein
MFLQRRDARLSFGTVAALSTYFAGTELCRGLRQSVRHDRIRKKLHLNIAMTLNLLTLVGRGRRNVVQSGVARTADEISFVGGVGWLDVSV